MNRSLRRATCSSTARPRTSAEALRSFFHFARRHGWPLRNSAMSACRRRPRHGETRRITRHGAVPALYALKRQHLDIKLPDRHSRLLRLNLPYTVSLIVRNLDLQAAVALPVGTVATPVFDHAPRDAR